MLCIIIDASSRRMDYFAIIPYYDYSYSFRLIFDALNLFQSSKALCKIPIRVVVNSRH